MNNIKESTDKAITCKELGTVHVSMYKNIETNLPLFYLDADNEEVLQLSYIIEDCLEDF